MAATHVRNARGSGLLLRDEIVQAARSILDEGGHESTVTLRAVARRVGIAAPSIYAHFSDADDIVQAVVVETFAEMTAFIAEAKTKARFEPKEQLLAGCEAYMTFGMANPQRYKLLFDRNRQLGGASPAGRDVGDDDLLVGSFGQLVTGISDCIDAGISQAMSARGAALELWVAMHGLVSLRGAQYEMPWPPRERIEPSLILALARIPA
jgi:AcrR family transcriptional regulator